jgi:amino acid adenylation domain-containing protein
MEVTRECCLHDLFEEQAAKTPGAIAVVFNDQLLSYDQLNGQASVLARHLRWLGVGPDVLVGVHLPRCLELLVSVLAVLKAGGAYLPLDPRYPKERLEFMMNDAQLKFVLTDSVLSSALDASRRRIVLVDSILDEGVSVSGKQLDKQVESGADRLAYVIYTSGSTGKPKGVQISHRALVNFLLSMQNAPGMNAADTLLAVTTLSFDIAALELFLPLSVGARVVIAGAGTMVDPHALAADIERHGITVLQATPAVWRLLVESGWNGNPRLKALCGGEAMPRDLANKLLDRCAELWNMYGPTEATVWCCIHKVERGSGPVPVGKPIANTQVYILDPDLKPVPAGTSGELLVGGVQIARGYLGRPELTAAKFIQNPFVSDPGSRLYRTGDSARCLDDGNIEFLGRMDYQVKIRGHRVELGEVETVLAEHPRVGQCVVVALDAGSGAERLAAYVAGTGQGAPSAKEMRDFLRRKLPDYMIPTAFVRLQGFPLSPNGKVDRRALPSPDKNSIATAHYVAPQTEAEKQMAAIWQETLRQGAVGVDDDFFDLGGHSLLAARLIGSVNRAFEAALDVMDLFANPTVRQFTHALESRSRSSHEPVLVTLQAGHPGNA